MVTVLCAGAQILPLLPPNTLLCVEAYVCPYRVRKQEIKMGNNVRSSSHCGGPTCLVYILFLLSFIFPVCCCVAALSMEMSQGVMAFPSEGTGKRVERNIAAAGSITEMMRAGLIFGCRVDCGRLNQYPCRQGQGSTPRASICMRGKTLLHSLLHLVVVRANAYICL
jgi:hypothetical protein